MNFKLVTSLFVLGSFLASFQSCKKEEDESNEGNETKISRYYDNESHNTGQNCIACHVSGGSGEGWFTTAGTVYDTNKTSVKPNSTIKLYTGMGGTGTLKATIEVDAKGNFYTTSDIGFGDGLYPEVISPNGNKMHMSSKTTTGNCASCHGVSTAKIWVN